MLNPEAPKKCASRRRVALLFGLLLTLTYASAAEDTKQTGQGQKEPKDAEGKEALASAKVPASTKPVTIKWSTSTDPGQPTTLVPYTKLSIHSRPTFYLCWPLVADPELLNNYGWKLDPADANSCVVSPADVLAATSPALAFRISNKAGKFKLIALCNTAIDTLPIEVKTPWEEHVVSCKFQKHTHKDAQGNDFNTRCATYTQMQIEGKGLYYGDCHVEEDFPHKEWTANNMAIPGTIYKDFDTAPWNYCKVGMRLLVNDDGTWGEDHCFFPEDYFAQRTAKNVLGEGQEKCKQHMLIYGKDEGVIAPVNPVEYTAHWIETKINTEKGKELFSVTRDSKEVRDPPLPAP